MARRSDLRTNALGNRPNPSREPSQALKELATMNRMLRQAHRGDTSGGRKNYPTIQEAAEHLGLGAEQTRRARKLISQVARDTRDMLGVVRKAREQGFERHEIKEIIQRGYILADRVRRGEHIGDELHKAEGKPDPEVDPTVLTRFNELHAHASSLRHPLKINGELKAGHTHEHLDRLHEKIKAHERAQAAYEPAPAHEHMEGDEPGTASDEPGTASKRKGAKPKVGGDAPKEGEEAGVGDLLEKLQSALPMARTDAEKHMLDELHHDGEALGDSASPESVAWFRQRAQAFLSMLGHHDEHLEKGGREAELGEIRQRADGKWAVKVTDDDWAEFSSYDEAIAHRKRIMEGTAGPMVTTPHMPGLGRTVGEPVMKGIFIDPAGNVFFKKSGGWGVDALHQTFQNAPQHQHQGIIDQYRPLVDHWHKQGTISSQQHADYHNVFNAHQAPKQGGWSVASLHQAFKNAPQHQHQGIADQYRPLVDHWHQQGIISSQQHAGYHDVFDAHMGKALTAGSEIINPRLVREARERAKKEAEKKKAKKSLRAAHPTNEYGHRDDLVPGMILETKRGGDVMVKGQGRFEMGGITFLNGKELLNEVYGHNRHGMTVRRYFGLYKADFQPTSPGAQPTPAPPTGTTQQVVPPSDSRGLVVPRRVPEKPGSPMPPAQPLQAQPGGYHHAFEQRHRGDQRTPPVHTSNWRHATSRSPAGWQHHKPLHAIEPHEFHPGMRGASHRGRTPHDPRHPSYSDQPYTDHPGAASHDQQQHLINYRRVNTDHALQHNHIDMHSHANFHRVLDAQQRGLDRARAAAPTRGQTKVKRLINREKVAAEAAKRDKGVVNHYSPGDTSRRSTHLRVMDFNDHVQHARRTYEQQRQALSRGRAKGGRGRLRQRAHRTSANLREHLDAQHQHLQGLDQESLHGVAHAIASHRGINPPKKGADLMEFIHGHSRSEVESFEARTRTGKAIRQAPKSATRPSTTASTPGRGDLTTQQRWHRTFRGDDTAHGGPGHKEDLETRKQRAARRQSIVSTAERKKTPDGLRLQPFLQDKVDQPPSPERQVGSRVQEQGRTPFLPIDTKPKVRTDPKKQEEARLGLQRNREERARERDQRRAAPRPTPVADEVARRAAKHHPHSRKQRVTTREHHRRLKGILVGDRGHMPRGQLHPVHGEHGTHYVQTVRGSGVQSLGGHEDGDHYRVHNALTQHAFDQQGNRVSIPTTREERKRKYRLTRGGHPVRNEKGEAIGFERAEHAAAAARRRLHGDKKHADSHKWHPQWYAEGLDPDDAAQLKRPRKKRNPRDGPGAPQRGPLSRPPQRTPGLPAPTPRTPSKTGKTTTQSEEEAKRAVKRQRAARSREA